LISKNDIRLFVYRHFIEIGKAPTLEEVSTEFDISKQQTIPFFQQLAVDQILVFEKDQQIRMALPFSNVPTQYLVKSGDRSWWSNCAWDALGISAMTGLDTHFEASCPDCGDLINIKIENGIVSGDYGVIHFVVPAEKWWYDIKYT